MQLITRCLFLFLVTNINVHLTYINALMSILQPYNQSSLSKTLKIIECSKVAKNLTYLRLPKLLSDK
jgi:hypothetical protein